ncbi:MAG: hypothetical protein J2P34_07905 [Actinobacteria bacterium]|nr:hypothetical protein [Actinomycetota bacterium]
MRRESSTVVGLVGDVPERLLTEAARPANVAVIRPPGDGQGSLEAASRALAEASRRMVPYVLVAADPLAAVAAAWQAMWDVARGPQGAADFEQQSAAALAAWRAHRFELPDYYLVVAAASEQPEAPGPPGFYLGPLRSARPHRVAAVMAADAAQQAAGVRQALRSLPHGPWWPPLPEVIDTARGFYAGGLAESAGSLASPGPA